MVEVDGVAEVDLAQLVEGRGGVAQRPVEVDRVDEGESSPTPIPLKGRSVAASVAATRSTPAETVFR